MVKKKRIAFIFGTRPEAIKMAPVIKEMERHGDEFEPVVVATAQHRGMLDQILRLFMIVPHHDLDVMQEDQSIEDVTVRCLQGLSGILAAEKPDAVLVQGDTTSTFVGALAASYRKILVGHVEAGLRSHDKYHPFPEESNRKLTTVLADLHFAPTSLAAENLARDGVTGDCIFVTGNTVIDALLDISAKEHEFGGALGEIFGREKRVILVTAHRRESFGRPLRDVCRALKEIAESGRDVAIVFPQHPNPHVREAVSEVIGNDPNIHLMEPLGYEEFVHVMKKSFMILTDSGGIQEEAPTLGKPVLVLREKTERKEAIESGVARLVGTNRELIVRETLKLLSDDEEYRLMANRVNPYGDGRAAERIVGVLRERLEGT